MTGVGDVRGGSEVGGYVLLDRIAPGSGQGQVFRAVDPSGATVSLKQISPGAIGAHRIEEMHAALVRRRHPALGRQLAVFRVSGDEALYVVARWVDGDTLATRARGATVTQVLRWTRQIAEGLDVLHADLDPDGPLLHRDVKPSNIVITPGGDAVLIDPGLARVGPSLATGSPYGTPGFVPPECVADPAAGSPAADGWQLAASLVSALLDEPPGWSDDRSALRSALAARCRGQIARPEVLADAVLDMLVPDPDERPSSAAAWVATLYAAAGPGGGHLRAPRRRWQVAGALGAASALVGIGVLAGMAARDGGADDPEPAALQSDQGFTREAVVDTRTTSGPHIDDQVKAYLSTEARARCRAFGCAVPGSTVTSGDRVTLTCFMNGERVTNGHDASPLDDANELLYESERWYGVTLAGGTSGLLSEVWVHPDHRGGQGLPFC